MRRRAWLGASALAGLAAVCVPLAMAGAEVVPASGRGGDPGWLLGPFGDGLGVDGDAYIHLERAALVLYALLLPFAAALPSRVIWGAVAALVALFAAAPPLLSLDVFSYVSYARLEALHGLNPYEHPPSAVAEDEALAFVEAWADSVSVYGPLFAIVTLPAGLLGVAAAVWSLKAMAAVAVLAIAWVVARLAALRGVDPRFAVVLVALNPVVLVHVVGGAHNDALMAALMTLSVAGVVVGRELSGGIGIVAASMVKASALLVAPFALLGADRPRRLTVGLLVGTAVLVGLGLALFGSSLDEAAKVIGQNQGVTSRASVPGTLSRELGLDLELARVLCLVAFGVGLCGLLVWTLRGADWVRAVGWGALGLLAATSYLTPWYVIWALPHAAVSRDRAQAVAAVAISAFLLREQVPGLGG